MRLFTIDDNDMVKVNSPWIRLIPEFTALFMVERKYKNYRYDERPLARKMLAYIYFMYDFSSPIFGWADDMRKAESLTYTGLTEDDIKAPELKKAIEKYEQLQHEMCRPLKTYKAALRGLEGLDKYLETINFNATDKQGKLLYTPNQFTQNIAYINKAYKELRDLKKMIEEEMSQSSGIRGNASMGDREMKANRKVMTSERETDIPENYEDHDNVRYSELGSILNEDDS